MNKETIVRFKKYYSKHLKSFDCDKCTDCPLNDGLKVGMHCGDYFQAIFGVKNIESCSYRKYLSKKMLEQYLKKEYKNKI